MSVITLDITAFRALFAAYRNPTNYTDTTLNAQWTLATAYVNPAARCWRWGSTQQRTMALYLMLAHLLALGTVIAAGQQPGVVTGATIDKITVTLQPPPEGSQFSYWLNQTPYGQQYLALVKTIVVGGYAIGGLPELSAFRKVDGIF